VALQYSECSDVPHSNSFVSGEREPECSSKTQADIFASSSSG